MGDNNFSLLEFLAEKLSTFEGRDEVLKELSNRVSGTEVYVGNFKEVIRRREVLKHWEELSPKIDRKTLTNGSAYEIIAQRIDILPTTARKVRYIVSGS